MVASLTELAIAAILVCLLCVAFTSFMIRRFRSIGTTAKAADQGSRWSKQSKPTIGGFVFMLAMLLAGLFAFRRGFQLDVLLLVLATAAAFALGLWDDMRRISASTKMAGQLIIASAFIGCQLLMLKESLTLVHVCFACISVFVIVGMMNSVNMLDNMDGISTIASIPLLFLSLSQDITFFPITLIFTAGLLAFLLFNWTPSRIFMGDSGSLLLGFFLSIILIRRASVDGMDLQGICRIFLYLIAAATIYLTDTTVVVINRLRHGVSPATGGRDHTTHNLVYLGLNEQQVAFVFLFLSLVQIGWLIWLDEKLLIDFTSVAQAFLPLLAHFFLLTIIFLFISQRNLRQGKFSYKK